MDINGFSLEQEYFGFSHYNSSPKSNLDFMYFTNVEDTEEYKKALRFHRDMVDNIRESGLPQGEIDRQLKEEEKRFNKEVLKIKGSKTLEGAGKVSSTIGSIFDKATSALGITKQTGVKEAPISVSYGGGGSGSRDKTLYWVIGGVAVLAIAGFIVYKMRK